MDKEITEHGYQETEEIGTEITVEELLKKIEKEGEK